MTNKLLIGIQVSLATALIAMVLISPSPARASEVTGTLSSGTASNNTVTGTVVGTTTTGSSVSGTITGGTGNTLSGTVVSDGVGGGGDSSGGGGGSRRSGGSNNNDDGEVLGADTEPDGVGGGFGTPGAPDTGAGGGLLPHLALMLASLAAGVAYLSRLRLN